MSEKFYFQNTDDLERFERERRHNWSNKDADDEAMKRYRKELE